MHLRIPAVLLLAATLLAGCGAPGPSPEERAALERPARALEGRGEWREAALAWQQAADAASGEAGLEFRLNAADALLGAGDGAGATAVVATLPQSLPPDLGLRRALVLADAALLAGDPQAALARVGPAVVSRDPALIARYRRIRADALEITGDSLGAARERALRDALLSSPQEIYRNRLRTWDLLGQVPDEVLAAQPLTPPQVGSGWIELASIARRNALDADALDAALLEWNVRYPAHPAGEQIVPELVERVRADARPPAKVALLLPQSGPFAGAAAAVRDGFMAAWFADAPNPERPEIIARDSASGDVALAYASAVAEGAQFVVGPLSKDEVNALLAGADLGVTTLTLNYPSLDRAALATGATAAQAQGAEGAAPATVTGGGAPSPAAGAAVATAGAATAPIDASAAPVAPTDQDVPAAPDGAQAAAPRDLSRVFHFALAPEDEAVEAAEYAFQRGARQAAVLAPRGDWGTRVAEAFEARWRELGGLMAASERYPDEATGYSSAVESLLNVDDSEQRARALRATLVRDIKHEPEPRSDLDVIFLAAFPQAARQLKPLLLFHRAGAVPVVATSHVFTGTPDRAADQDIDGTVFGDMPWVVEPDRFVLPGRVRAIWPAAGGSLGRLYAFGADAYALVSGLRALRTGAARSLPGHTGTLSLSADHRVRRALDWVQVRDGVPQVIGSAPLAGAGPPPWGVAVR